MTHNEILLAAKDRVVRRHGSVLKKMTRKTWERLVEDAREEIEYLPLEEFNALIEEYEVIE